MKKTEVDVRKFEQRYLVSKPSRVCPFVLVTCEFVVNLSYCPLLFPPELIAVILL